MRIGLALVFLAACGGNAASQPASPAKTESKDTSSTPAADAGASTERPFAGSAVEATELIQQALEKKTAEMNECVKQWRFRKHLAHERVDIAVGIDQEGHVLGVTLPKRQPDDELSKCVMAAVHDVKFPKSHAGVITVTRSFEEMVR